MLKKILVATAILSLSIYCSHGQVVNPQPGNVVGQTGTGVITTAVPFLLVAPDSRGAGMGDIGVASSADANSQHYNPAKYIFSKNLFGISVSYSPWLRKLTKDMNLLYLAAYYKVTPNDAIAFSLRYFSLGEITFTDPQGEVIGIQHPNEFALDFTYSRRLSTCVSMALTPRFTYSDLTNGVYVGAGIETQAGVAGSADLSLFYEQDFAVKGLTNSTLRIGVNLSNLGSKVSYGSNRRDFLPANFRLGASYSMDLNEHNRISVLGEIGKLMTPTQPIFQQKWDTTGNIWVPDIDESGNNIIYSGYDADPRNVSVALSIFRSWYDAPGRPKTKVPDAFTSVPSRADKFKEEMREFVWALGIEYSYRDLLFIRAGYFNESADKGARKYFTVGAGIHYNVFGIDVSYLASLEQAHPLENTLRFTLTFDFVSFNKEKIRNQGRMNDM